MYSTESNHGIILLKDPLYQLKFLLPFDIQFTSLRV